MHDKANSSAHQSLGDRLANIGLLLAFVGYVCLAWHTLHTKPPGPAQTASILRNAHAAPAGNQPNEPTSSLNRE
jgi:hypothetical protein